MLSNIHVLAMVVGWLALGVILLRRRGFQEKTVQKRDRRSLLGMAIQGMGFASVFSFQRKVATLPLTEAGWYDVISFLAGTLILGCSVWMVQSAVSTLGKQWSLAARVLEKHSLVTSGPYRFVRHPIYAAMFGMVLGSGILVSRWEAVVVGAVFYLGGTFLRVRIEERLLRAAFGAAYEEYARKVPALLPKWPGT